MKVLIIILCFLLRKNFAVEDDIKSSFNDTNATVTTIEFYNNSDSFHTDEILESSVPNQEMVDPFLNENQLDSDSQANQPLSLDYVSSNSHQDDTSIHELVWQQIKSDLDLLLAILPSPIRTHIITIFSNIQADIIFVLRGAAGPMALVLGKTLKFLGFRVTALGDALINQSIVISQK